MYRDMADSEFACALSHHEIYKAIVERGLPDAVILEDDAKPAPEFFDYITHFSPPPFELLLFDHKNARVSRETPTELTKSARAFKVRVAPHLTTGYYLTQPAASKFIAQSLPISAPADWPCDITKFTCAAVMPRLVEQTPPGDGSDIEAQRQQYATSGRVTRFLTPAYWHRWFLKRSSMKL